MVQRRFDLSAVAKRAAALGPVLDTMSRVAASRTSILIVGDSQAAELLARAIHAASPRAGGPLVRVDCAAMAPVLLAQELFGWPSPERGRDPRIGRIGDAHRGTVLLQGIDATDARIQMRLAEILKEHQYLRNGDETPTPADIRLIAHCADGLEGRVAEGKFRSDLFYQLNVVSIVLPAALGKRNDIMEVIDFFRMEAKLRARDPVTRKRTALRWSKAMQGWPAAALEVGQRLERLLAQRPALPPEAILPALVQAWGHNASATSVAAASAESGVLESTLLRCVQQAVPSGEDSFEALMLKLQKALIRHVLAEVGGVEAKAAEFLGVTPPTLSHKMRELGLE